jgi:hypothetical protein
MAGFAPAVLVIALRQLCLFVSKDTAIRHKTVQKSTLANTPLTLLRGNTPAFPGLNHGMIILIGEDGRCAIQTLEQSIS